MFRKGGNYGNSNFRNIYTCVLNDANLSVSGIDISKIAISIISSLSKHLERAMQNPTVMQNPVKERIVKLRDEIAQISEENRLYLRWAARRFRAQCGSRTSAAKIAGNPRRIGVVDRLEETMSALTNLEQT